MAFKSLGAVGVLLETVSRQPAEHTDMTVAALGAITVLAHGCEPVRQECWAVVPDVIRLLKDAPRELRHAAAGSLLALSAGRPELLEVVTECVEELRELEGECAHARHLLEAIRAKDRMSLRVRTSHRSSKRY